MEAADSA